MLIPGFGTDFTAFARQIPVLAQQRQVWAVNLRGVGVSDPPGEGPYEVGTAADEVAGLAGQEPVDWVGASLGAAVALEVAWRHPERVRSLSLITPFLEVGPRLGAVLDAWAALSGGAAPEVLAAALVPWLFSEAALGEAVQRARWVRGLAEIAPRTPPATLVSMAAGLRAWSGSRKPADLGALRAPTLVLGAGADLLTPGVEALAEAVPGARLVIVPKAGHAVALEAPDAVNGAILQHIAS